MRLKEFVPSCIKKKEVEIKGSVSLKRPSFDQIMEMTELIEKNKQGDTIAAKKSVEWSEQFYHEVKLKNSDGYVYKDFKDLKLDNECYMLLIEVAAALANGFKEEKKPL